MPAPTRTIPVTLLTGALGAGKTTLAAAALAAQPGRSVGLIVNEVGDVGIDGELLGASRRDAPAELVELTSGCLCCSVRGELDSALRRMARSGVDHLLIETTGVADPGPVIDAVAGQPALLRLGSVVCVVDARNVRGQLADRRRPQLHRQIQLASTIVISKSDLVGSVEVEAARAAVLTLNDHAEVHVATRGEVPPGVLLDDGAFRPDRIGTLEPPKPARRKYTLGRAPVHPIPETIAVNRDGDLDLGTVLDWLRGLMVFKGPDLMRIKGILSVSGMDAPIVIHGVHGYLETAPGEGWGQQPRRSRIVAIGHDLDADLWQRALDDCAAESVVPRR